jgi:hypothetical protein
MKENKPKLPQSGGAKKAAQIFEETRKKQPSDKLVKIISEVPSPEPETKPIPIKKIAKDAQI